MKKIMIAFLSMIFALGALSITGCSGDLHDEEEVKRGAEIPGYSYYLYGGLGVNANALNNVFERVEGGDGEYECTFDFENNGWGAGEGLCNATLVYAKKDDVVNEVWDGGLNKHKYGTGVNKPDPTEAGAEITLVEGKGDGNGNNICLKGKAGDRFKATWNPVTLKFKYEKATGGSSDPVPYKLDGWGVLGIHKDSQWALDFGKTLLLNPTVTKKTGECLYTLDIPIKADGAAIHFGIVGAGNWNPCYAKAEVGSDWTELAKCEGGDNKATFASALSIAEDDTVRLSIKTTTDQKVYAKAAKLTTVTVSGATVTFTGLPAAIRGITFTFTGAMPEAGDNNPNWAAPGDSKCLNVDVSQETDKSTYQAVVTLPDLSKAFEDSDTKEFSIQGKCAQGAGWDQGAQITGPDGGNAEFKIKPNAKAVVFEYKDSKSITGGTAYSCTLKE